jgi:hypothetical protein
MWINDNRGTVRAQPVVPGPPRQILPGKTAIQAKREAGPIIRMAVMISRKSVIMGTLLAMTFTGIKRQGAINLQPCLRKLYRLTGFYQSSEKSKR